MKKITLLVLILSVLFSSSALFAVDTAESMGTTVSYQKDLTYEEAVEFLMDKKNITVREAEKILGDKPISTKGEQIIYREYITIQAFGMGMSAEYGIFTKIYTYNSFGEFLAVLDEWAEAGEAEHIHITIIIILK